MLSDHWIVSLRIEERKSIVRIKSSVKYLVDNYASGD